MVAAPTAAPEHTRLAGFREYKQCFRHTSCTRRSMWAPLVRWQANHAEPPASAASSSSCDCCSGLISKAAVSLAALSASPLPVGLSYRSPRCSEAEGASACWGLGLVEAARLFSGSNAASAASSLDAGSSAAGVPDAVELPPAGADAVRLSKPLPPPEVSCEIGRGQGSSECARRCSSDACLSDHPGGRSGSTQLFVRRSAGQESAAGGRAGR